jgi:hypothetical protein
MMPRFEQARKFTVDLLSGPRVVFHHVPKCGGTSIAQALRLRYAVSFAGFPTPPIYRAVMATEPAADEASRARLVDEFQERLLLYYLYSDIRCIAGHVRFSQVAHNLFSKSYKFVTTLREPVSMMISHYFFLPRRSAEIFTSVDDIDAYLESEEARHFGAVYPYYFNGGSAHDEPWSDAAMCKAKKNLRLLDVVGFVDDIPRFQRQLRDHVGLRLRIGHANRSVASREDRKSVITPTVRRRIEELSAPNIEIYEFAKRELQR